MTSAEQKNEQFIRAMLQKIDRDAEYALQAAGIRMLETARERTPRAGQKYATGALGNSLRISNPDRFTVQLSAGVPYAIYMEYGTGPKGKATGAYPVRDMEGKEVYQPEIHYHGGFYIRTDGTKVNTQGMDAHPYIRPALQAGVNELQKALNAIFGKKQ